MAKNGNIVTYWIVWNVECLCSFFKVNEMKVNFTSKDQAANLEVGKLQFMFPEPYLGQKSVAIIVEDENSFHCVERRFLQQQAESRS